MTITALPTPPSPSDSPATFNSKAFDLLGALPTFVTEANALEAENAAAASAAATAAATAALASKLDAANPSYTGTLTGGTGVVNLGSGQFVKDASGNVGVGKSAGLTHKLTVVGNSAQEVFNATQTAVSTQGYLAGTGVYTFGNYFGTGSSWVWRTNSSGGGEVDRMTLDASGNVGLGVTPSAWGGGYKAFQVGLYSGFAYEGGKTFVTTNAYHNGTNWIYPNSDFASRYQQQGGAHTWYTAPSGTAGNPISFTTAMTLDASGNLLVGGTSNAANARCILEGTTGYQLGLRYGGVATWYPRVDSSGNLIFEKDGTEAARLDNSGSWTPGIDNAQSNGSGAKRWSVIYAGTGTINTSDAREKTAVRLMAADEIEAAKALSKEVGVYQFLDSVAIKGDKARHHIGMTVQRAIEIMEAHGLNPFAYGFICYDKWDEQVTEHPAVEAREAVEAKDAVLDDEGNVIEPAVEAQPAIEAKDAWTEVTQKAGDRYSFRYDQLTLFIAKGIHARLEALEAA